jgi:hypothetical protein
MFRKVLLVISLVLLVGLLTACTSEGKLLPELQEPVSFLIQKLIEYLLIPLLLMLIAWLYALARTQWQKFRLKNPDEAYWISYVISTVVMAAEQMADAYPDAFESKKVWAIGKAEEWFAKLGITLDGDQISDLIEAEVNALFNASNASGGLDRG